MSGADDAPEPRTFEWDESKRRRNVLKHGIDFADAIKAFADPRCHIYRSHTQLSERRHVAVGKVDGRVIAVVFTERGNAIRIISARAARRSERKIYESP